MDGGDVEGPVFTEKDDPFFLQEVRPYGVDGNGIGSHDQPLVGPDVPFVEIMGSSSIELRREGAEDIQAGLSLSPLTIYLKPVFQEPNP